MYRRRLVLAVLPLTITVAACELDLFSGEPSSDPGSLEGWRVKSLEGGIGDCPVEPSLQGTSPADARPWAVGASVDVEVWFSRPCGMFRECLPLNVTFSTSEQNVWQVRSSPVPQGAQVDAVGPGVAHIGVSVDGQPFGEVELRAVSPESLQVDRLVIDNLTVTGATETLDGLALVSNGNARVLARLFDVSGTHLCGTPIPSVTASGLTVVGTGHPPNDPARRANDDLILQAHSTAGPAAVTLSVGDATTTIELGVVDVAALTGLKGSFIVAGPVTAYIRLRALADEQEVAGVLVQLENLTPNVFQMFEMFPILDPPSDPTTTLRTREPAVLIHPSSGRTSSQGQVRLSVPGTGIAPMVFEFTVP